MDEFYLGDGLYVSSDGYQIKLRAPRMHGDSEVFLEPAVLKNFLNYIEQLKEPQIGDIVRLNNKTRPHFPIINDKGRPNLDGRGNPILTNMFPYPEYMEVNEYHLADVREIIQRDGRAFIMPRMEE